MGDTLDRPMFRVLFLIALVLPTDVALGKCAMRQYLFEGVVRDGESARPVPGARVYVFLDQEKSVWSRGYQTTVPEFAETDERGGFRASTYLDTYNGSRFLFFGDDCSKRPRRAEVLVIAPGFLARRIAVNDLHFSSETAPVRVPSIDLYSQP